jgi:NAD(P)H-dependent FMN reductase
MSLRILVVYGSVRSTRQGIRAARFVVNECSARGHEVTLIDPLEYRLPLLDKMYKEYPKGEAPEILERLAALIVPSDAVVVVSGEYNHSDPARALEPPRSLPRGVVLEAIGDRVLLGRAPFGGVRAAMQLRMMLAELGMASIPSIFPVPTVQNAFARTAHPPTRRCTRRQEVPRRSSSGTAKHSAPTGTARRNEASARPQRWCQKRDEADVAR